MSENKKNFEVEIGGKLVKFSVVKPGYKVSQKSSLVYNKAFREAVENGLLVRAKLDKVLRDQMLWDDDKQKRYVETVTQLLNNEKILAKGGIKLSEAKRIALEMRRARALITSMSAERNEMDLRTAEAYAEQRRFDYLVASCTVYSDTGKPYFSDVEEFLDRQQDDPVASHAAEAMGRLMYGLSDDFEKKQPENAFLLQHKFVNDKLALVNKEGKLIDEYGNLVDENGHLVNEQGELVDRDGTAMTADGQYKVEFTEFIDDINEPASEPKTEEVDKV